MDIGGWLRSLGLERYEAAFRENAIDADVLRDLTDQDLEKLGVLLGDRRRLLRAIAALDGASAAASSPVPVPSPVTSALISAAAASPTSSTVEVSGERRHVTAMFYDLVDLTGIAAKLDPRRMARSSWSLLKPLPAQSPNGVVKLPRSSAMASLHCSAIPWRMKAICNARRMRRS